MLQLPQGNITGRKFRQSRIRRTGLDLTVIGTGVYTDMIDKTVDEKKNPCTVKSYSVIIGLDYDKKLFMGHK
jgi:hypothetical protein